MSSRPGLLDRLYTAANNPDDDTVTQNTQTPNLPGSRTASNSIEPNACVFKSGKTISPRRGESRQVHYRDTFIPCLLSQTLLHRAANPGSINTSLHFTLDDDDGGSSERKSSSVGR